MSDNSVDYVIVGAGVAAASAVTGIRSEDASGTIGVIGSEPDKPVYRPVLSKDLWLKDDETLEVSSLAGPLDAKTRRLINLAFAIAANSEGAAHSHTRRALAENITPDELHHVAYLAITTLGWPHAIRGLTWIQDYTRQKP